MKLIGLGVVVAAAISAQQPGSISPATATDPQLYADVLALVQLEGSKQRIESNMHQMVDQGVSRMMKDTSQCNAAFAAEWGKRMLAKINADDFVNVEIAAYERHFSDADIRELISRLKKQRENPASAVPSPGLKQKLEGVLPSVQSEILGGTTQVGAKLGGEIGQQIQKEHPEYCRGAAPRK